MTSRGSRFGPARLAPSRWPAPLPPSPRCFSFSSACRWGTALRPPRPWTSPSSRICAGGRQGRGLGGARIRLAERLSAGVALRSVGCLDGWRCECPSQGDAGGGCGRGRAPACGCPLGSVPVFAAPCVASQPASCRGFRRIPVIDLVAKALNNESRCMGMTVLRVLACSGNAFSWESGLGNMSCWSSFLQ